MKTRIPTIITMFMALHTVTGDALKETVRGGLLGAAAGALVSSLSEDDDARYTIPFYTGLGALTGYAVYQHQGGGRRYAYGPRRRYPSGAAYGLPYLALPYAAWHVHRPRPYRADSPAAGRTTPPAPLPVNRHPGVRLIPVPVSLPNGTVTPITILKLGERYIGPRGETYEQMPDAATLGLRYRP